MKKIGDMKTLAVRVDRTVHAQIAQQAQHLGISIAELSRQIINKGMEKNTTNS